MLDSQIVSIRDPEQLDKIPELWLIRDAIINSYDAILGLYEKRGYAREGTPVFNLKALEESYQEVLNSSQKLKLLRAKLSKEPNIIKKLNLLHLYLTNSKKFLLQDEEIKYIKSLYEFTTLTCGVTVDNTFRFLRDRYKDKFEFFYISSKNSPYFKKLGHIVGIVKTKTDPEKWIALSPGNIFNPDSTIVNDSPSFMRSTDLIVSDTLEGCLAKIKEIEGGDWTNDDGQEQVDPYSFDDQYVKQYYHVVYEDFGTKKLKPLENP